MKEAWDTIWRSELRALAEDRELRETVARALDAAGRAWAAPPPRPAPAAVPPVPGGTDELARRVEELERRLAVLAARSA